MNEDEITNALIQWHRASEIEAKEIDESSSDVQIYPEAHFNHYGNRGVVDLYTLTGDWSGHVFEIKSESAVKKATGANEIIRQFNRIREFFFDGSNVPRPSSKLMFELCFTPTAYNANHIIENADLYASAVTSEISSEYDIDVKSVICFRLPDAENIEPLLMFSRKFDYRDRIEGGDFANYIDGKSDLYSRISSAFDIEL